jgi:hypothetical protein
MPAVIEIARANTGVTVCPTMPTVPGVIVSTYWIAGTKIIPAMGMLSAVTVML